MSENNNLHDTLAITLEYSDQHSAPRVTAKGTGYIAQQIIELAQQHNIPIKQDLELSALLSQVEINQEIPPILYEAIAQVLIFAYQISGKPLPKKDNNTI